MAAYQEKRLAASQALTVASAAGAAVSTTIFGSKTYAIACSFPGSFSSTGGMRIAVIDVGAAVVSSTTGTFLPANWIQNSRCHLASGFPSSAMMLGRLRLALQN